MSENWAIALTIFCLGQFATVLIGGVVAYFNLSEKVGVLRLDAEHRFTELETNCEKWFVLAGANGLHRDDNRHGADQELERFVILYRHHNHDLPADEWVHYHAIFTKLSVNTLATPNERALAEGMKELCAHKMMRDKTTHTSRLI